MKKFAVVCFIFIPFWVLSQNTATPMKETALPPCRDSIVSIFYDKITDKFYRYFCNKTDSVEQGYQKYPRDEKRDELHYTKQFVCGVLGENGMRYVFGYNERLISISGNTAVTSIENLYSGRTFVKSYQIAKGGVLIRDTLHFDSPFVYGCQAFDGEYILFNAGGEGNMNFAVFNKHLKYLFTYTPFQDLAYRDFKIISSDQTVTIATAGEDSVRIAYFDKQFKLIDDKKIKLHSSKNANEISSFGEFVGFGKTLLFTTIARRGNDNVMFTTAYDRNGKFLWKKEYVPYPKMGFVWNHKTDQMIALLFKNKQPYIGLFDEEKGYFIDSLNYEAYYKQLYPTKESNIKIRPVCARWLGEEKFIFVFGELEKQKDVFSCIDNISILRSGPALSVVSKTMLPQPLQKMDPIYTRGKIRLSTFDKMIEYEK